MPQKWVPIVEKDLCTGCGACVEACGPACLEMQDGYPVLARPTPNSANVVGRRAKPASRVARSLAVLARPDDCGSEEHCIAPCPTEAIRMAWVAMEGNPAVGRWQEE